MRESTEKFRVLSTDSVNAYWVDAHRCSSCTTQPESLLKVSELVLTGLKLNLFHNDILFHFFFQSWQNAY